MTTHIDIFGAGDDDFDDEPYETVLDEAVRLARSGERVRAERILGHLVSGGGDDAISALLEWASLFHSDGHDARARDLVREAWAIEPTIPAWNMQGAELAEELGDLEHALAWADRAVAALDQKGDSSFIVSRGRARIREKLGLPADDMDRDALEAAEQYIARMSRDNARLRAAADVGPAVYRVLFWPQREVDTALMEWPEVVEGYVAGERGYLDDREALNRNLSASGSTVKIRMVPLTVEALRAGAARLHLDPTTSELREALVGELADAGHGVVWPPARNEKCWCGSGSKYKRCCGRAG